MAHIVTTHGIHALLSLATTGTTDLRMAVFVGAEPAAATVRDYDFLSSVTGAMTEAAAANYGRQDLANVTITEVDGSDNVTITADAPTINSVGAGETWTTVAYYIYNAADAAAVLISLDTPASSIATNGGNITLPALSLTVAQA